MLYSTLTLSDALVSAGGQLAGGRAGRVELRRGGDVVEVLLLARDNQLLADTPIRSGDQLLWRLAPFLSLRVLPRQEPTQATVIEQAS
jgi:hypothetical protein